jgi:DNA-directed RNA polymerase subunit K/omega
MGENLLSSSSEGTDREQNGFEESVPKPSEKPQGLRRDFLAEDFLGKAQNIYEAIIVMSKRARQIGQKQAHIIEEHMATKMQNSDSDDSEGEEGDIVRKPLIDEDDDDAPKFPKFEKPTVLAMNELHSGDLKYEKKGGHR